MKSIFIAICVLFLCSQPLHSQSLDPILHLNQQRQQKTQKAMLVLGSWSVINIGSGLILQANTSGSDKYFHQMNAGWNTINLGLAAISLWRLQKDKSSNYSAFETMQQLQRLQKILLFNAGLDIGYMTAGAWLIERGRNTAEVNEQERYDGWGKSLLLQGGFLFAFDIVTYLALRAENPKLEALFANTRVGANGVRWVYNF